MHHRARLGATLAVVGTIAGCASVAEALGGVVFLDPGGRGTFEVELTAGDYGLICFFPDTRDGKPHLAHGMMTTIKVPAST